MSQTDAYPQVPVSWGELIDKVTILRIKQQRIGSAAARANVARELSLLQGIAGGAMTGDGTARLVNQLQAVNEELWEIEDAIRECEAAGDFGPRFVQLARSVYQRNDLRAAIKREINQQLGSGLIEEKSYAGYGAGPQEGRAAAPVAATALG